MNCYNCANLDPEKKKAGKVAGNLYFCKKNKVYVNAAKTTCEHYEKSYRQKDQDSDIYEDSKEYYDNDTPISFYIVILIALIIIGLIMGVFTIN